MIRDLKLGIKLWKYSFQWKQNIVLGTVFFLLATVMILMESMKIYGLVYWLILGTIIMMQFENLSASSMVKSSPKSRAMLTSTAAVMSFLIHLILYAAFTAARILTWNVMGQGEYPNGELVLFGLMSTVVMIYYSIVYQLREWAAACWIVVMFAAAWGVELLMDAWVQPVISTAASFGIGILLILLGGCLQYGIARRTCRRPFSSATMLRRMENYK